MQRISIASLADISQEIYGNKYDFSNSKLNGRHKSFQVFCNIHQKYFPAYTDRYFKKIPCPDCRKDARRKENCDNFLKEAEKLFPNYDYSKVKYVNCDTKVEIICPVHGSFFATPYEHLKSKGCPKCLGRNLTTEEFVDKIKALFGNKYDYSKVVYKGAKEPVILVCQTCGKEFNTIPNNLLNNQGCPFCGMAKFQKAGNIAYAQKCNKIYLEKIKAKYGDKYDYNLIKETSVNSFIKIKCNSCNKIFSVRAKYFLKGCECPCQRKNGSVGEREIAEFLKSHNISFVREKTFSDLRDKRNLRFDFYLPDKNICIEFNGEQHYRWIKKFHHTYKDFLIQKHHDWLKRKYCLKNGIKLIVIPFFANIGELKNEALI